MRIRLIFYCPRCGSVLFRPSANRGFRDYFMGSFGVHAQRCYMCRHRFYLFKPDGLKGLLKKLDRPQPSLSPEPVPAPEGVELKSKPVATPISLARNFRRQFEGERQTRILERAANGDSLDLPEE